MEIKKHTHKDGERFYEIDGEFLPSATTVLDCYPLEAGLKQFLQDKTKEQADKLLNEAALQGSKIHHTIELLLMGEEIFSTGVTEKQLDILDLHESELKNYLREPFTEKEDKMMKGFLNWWEEFKPETVESEKMVYSKKYGYAGTMDWLGYITTNAGKELVVVDWKTGKGLYKSYDLQVSSYVYANAEMVGKAKKPTAAFLLQLGVNRCGYKFQEIKDIKKDFKSFLRILETWKELHPAAKPREYQFALSYKIR